MVCSAIDTLQNLKRINMTFEQLVKAVDSVKENYNYDQIKNFTVFCNKVFSSVPNRSLHIYDVSRNNSVNSHEDFSLDIHLGIVTAID